MEADSLPGLASNGQCDPALGSRTLIPAEALPASQDRRRLDGTSGASPPVTNMDDVAHWLWRGRWPCRAQAPQGRSRQERYGLVSSLTLE
jgi:hypothetical protein